MANFVVFALAVILLSTNVSCGKQGVYDPEFEYQYDVIERLVRLEETGDDRDGEMDNIGRQVANITSILKDADETIKSLKQKIETLQTNGFVKSASFTRWGHTECDGDAEVVYLGYMAGSNSGHTGGGSNYICITTKPKWGEYDDRAENIGLLYGVEYKISGDKYNHDALCVVCRIPRSSVIMTPGTNDCEDGWTLEYSGYLVSQAYTQQSKDFVCLDENPKGANSGSAYQGGGYIYKVEGRCGSLKCPPYVNGREITCAVCSYGSRVKL